MRTTTMAAAAEAQDSKLKWEVTRLSAEHK
jgi:hypothetical protein